MTALFQVRRRAEEFAALVDAPAGSPVDAGSDRLLAVVGELRHQGDVLPAHPRPEFSADLRTRLMAEAVSLLDRQSPATPATPASVPVHQRGRGERRLVVAATVAVLVGGSAGMAAASQQALPGEVLYPVKRVLEQVQAGTAMSPAAKGRDLLSQASGRLEEVRGLLESGSVAATEEVPGTLQEFRNQARGGADELMTSYRDTGDADTIATVRGFTAKNLSTLVTLSAGAPADAAPALHEAANTLQSIDREASALCPDCTSLPPLQVPPALSASTQADGAPAAAAGEASTLGSDRSALVPLDLLDATQALASQSASPQTPSAGTSAASPFVPASPFVQLSAPPPTVAASDTVVPLPTPSDTATPAAPTPQPTTPQPQPTTPQPTALESSPPTPEPTSTEPSGQDTQGSSPTESTDAPSIGGAGLSDTPAPTDNPAATGTNPVP